MPRPHAPTTFRLVAGTTYQRLCDASGAAFLNANTFVAGSDETQSPNGENRLQIYKLGKPAPSGQLNLNAYLKLDPDDETEADIESAARIGNTIYWITSHGRDSKGHKHPNRQRLFATRVKGDTVTTEGRAYSELLNEIIEHNDELKAAYKAKLAPEEGGISIEGLCQGPANTLWIGFRSPLAYSRALCAEIANPNQVVKGLKPKISRVWGLNLGNRGIRDWTRWGYDWLILAGSAQDADDFALYSWDGDEAKAPKLLGDVTQALKAIGYDGMHPETVTVAPNGTVWLFADDGGVKFHDGKNKKLPEAKRRFRSVRVVFNK